MTDDALPPRISYVSALSKDLYTLARGGYREVDHPPTAAGEYQLVGQDVAPGYGEYMYDIDVWELPDALLSELGWVPVAISASTRAPDRPGLWQGREDQYRCSKKRPRP